MADTSIDAKISQIQKLLALGKSSNEAEANLAMARAQRLMTELNLTYAMIEDAQQTTADVREKVQVDRSARYQYQRDLWRALAEANYCWHSILDVWPERETQNTGTFRYRRTEDRPKKRHMILGRRSNVIAVQTMGEYLEDTMSRLTSHLRGSAVISWKNGCVDRLIERIGQNKEKSDKATGNENALVLKSLADREYAGNYDFKHGDGAYAQKLLQDAEWEAGQAERDKRAQEYEAQKEREWLEYLQSETPEQKKGRERREAAAMRAEDRRYSRSTGRRDEMHWEAERRKEAKRTGNDHYKAGSAASSKIGLSVQVAAKQKPRMLK